MSARIAHLPIVVVSPLLIESIKTSTRRLREILNKNLFKKMISYSISAVLIVPGPRSAPNSAKIPKTNVPKNID